MIFTRLAFWKKGITIVFFSRFFSQTLDLNKKLNCCTGILLECFDQLKTLASKKEGLLYGVPVSIKDNIKYKVFSDYEAALIITRQQLQHMDNVSNYTMYGDLYVVSGIAQV